MSKSSQVSKTVSTVSDSGYITTKSNGQNVVTKSLPHLPPSQQSSEHAMTTTNGGSQARIAKETVQDEHGIVHNAQSSPNRPLIPQSPGHTMTTTKRGLQTQNAKETVRDEHCIVVYSIQTLPTLPLTPQTPGHAVTTKGEPQTQNAKGAVQDEHGIVHNTRSLPIFSLTPQSLEHAVTAKSESQAHNAKETVQDEHGIVHNTQSLPNMPLRPQSPGHAVTSSSVGNVAISSQVSVKPSTHSGRIKHEPPTKPTTGPSGQKIKPPPLVGSAEVAVPELQQKLEPKPKLMEHRAMENIYRQIYRIKNVGLTMQNYNELQKFGYCMALEVGCFLVATGSIMYSLSCLTMFTVISVWKFSDWQFVYQEKMDLLVFILYHLAIRVLLAVHGINLVIGMLKQSDLMLRISLYGFWVHLALNWLALGALTLVCTVQGYCFQSESVPTLLFMFFLTILYSGLWLYAIWTVNSYRINIENDDDDSIGNF